MLLTKTIIYKLVDRVLSDQQDDFAIARLRQPVDSILGLQVVDQVEGAVKVDRSMGFGERQTLARGGRVGDQQPGLGRRLEDLDRPVPCLPSNFAVDAYGTKGRESPC